MIATMAASDLFTGSGGMPELAYHPLVRSVDRALRGPCRLAGDPMGGLLVGVSGGSDSVALCRALHLLSTRRGRSLRLVIGHVQHHLRGAAAEAEAVWVCQLAGSLGIPFLRRDIQPDASKGNLEAVARQQRYSALLAMAAESDCSSLATAHHGDDQLETLLLRLLRGSGLEGMRGLRWRRRLSEGRTLLRPMLGADRALAMDFLLRLGQDWCEDATNTDVRRARARLRQQVLPALRAIQPRAARRAQAWAEHAQAATGQWRAAVREADHRLPGPMLPRAALRALDRSVASGLLRRRLAEAGVPADALGAAAIRALLRAVRDERGGERRFHFAGGVQALVRRDQVELFAATTAEKEGAA